jgi:hypothetical protein
MSAEYTVNWRLVFELHPVGLGFVIHIALGGKSIIFRAPELSVIKGPWADHAGPGPPTSIVFTSLGPGTHCDEAGTHRNGVPVRSGLLLPLAALICTPVPPIMFFCC